MRVWGLGFRVWGLGIRVSGVGFRVGFGSMGLANAAEEQLRFSTSDPECTLGFGDPLIL